MLNKLITKEDPYNIHKGLGLFCIINYLFQYYSYFTTGEVILNVYTLLPHIFLHISSFIFKVLSKRGTESKLSMFIWEELRLHALVFAWRACFAILFINYTQTITLLSMIFADIVSYYYGTSGVSTVRGKHENIVKRNIYKKISGSFFSMSQMGATVITSGIFQKSPSNILIFSTLPPIQTSAFGMTLIRKNLITYKVWNIVYSIELIITYIFWYKEHNNLLIIPLTVILYLLRLMGISKYVIWCIAYYLHNTYYNVNNSFILF
jgi:hypothetical protein